MMRLVGWSQYSHQGMRIVVVHNLQPGGARRRLANQIDHFQGSVFEICLETATPITPDCTVVPLRPFAPRKPRMIRPPLRYLDMVMLERAWRRAGHRMAGFQPDVVYLNPCRFLQAPPVLSSDMPPSLYFCDEVRRVDDERDGRSSRNPFTAPLYRPLYSRQRRIDRVTALHATALATNSRYTATQIERVYGRRATVVRLGVTESLITPTPDRATGGFLLSVGTLISSKGHDLVLQAAALADSRPSVRIVAPRPSPREQARLKGLADELGIPVEIDVAIDDAALRDLYAAATVTLYLALREPFGLVSLEAQALGCPVVVANDGGLPETILEGVTGWSVEREPVAVAALVDRLADSRVRAAMSAAARAHALEWSWHASAVHVESIFEELCVGPPATRK